MQRIYRPALLSALLLGAGCSQIGRGVVYQTYRARFAPCGDAAKAGARIVVEPPLRYIEARRPFPIAQVLYFHGVGKGACDKADLIQPLQAMGCDLILAEYPGFDGKGQATEAAILGNALALYDRIAGQRPGLPLLLYGESLGTAVATYVASRRACDALLLHAPFTSALEVGESSYAMLPVKLFMSDHFPADEWAKKVTAPVLAFSGTRDWVVPTRFSRKQMKNFKGEARLLIFEGAGHESMISREPGRYFGAFQALLRRVALCE